MAALLRDAMEVAWEVERHVPQGGMVLRGVPNRPVARGLRLRLMGGGLRLIPAAVVITQFSAIMRRLGDKADVRFYWDADRKRIVKHLRAAGLGVNLHKHGVSTLVGVAESERVLGAVEGLAGGACIALIGEGRRQIADGSAVMETMGALSYFVLLELYDDAMLIEPRVGQWQDVLEVVRRWSLEAGVALKQVE